MAYGDHPLYFINIQDPCDREVDFGILFIGLFMFTQQNNSTTPDSNKTSMSTNNLIRTFLPVFAGITFAVAWWLWIDSHVWSHKQEQDHPDDHPATVKVVYYIPGLVATLGLIMTNLVSLESTNIFDEEVSSKVRVWLFASFLVSLGAIAAGIWIMAANYLSHSNNPSGQVYPGVALTVQNFLIFLSQPQAISGKIDRTNTDQILTPPRLLICCSVLKHIIHQLRKWCTGLTSRQQTRYLIFPSFKRLGMTVH
ncbi:hypothetical protein PROFUN_06528 [Planoprotostelium fungivorum]|uniref:Transmembrane protein n=1 Tax=Planoprotostelium fungivorum TaxID=1890364 RepID=A0A2P6NP13_9EUKA|nr:hypothetical protein PROFUN_06528 [Planoprotostelium fungivorum]